MRWYAKERKERSLTADEEKTVLWLKENYGLEALLRNVSMESGDWTQRKGKR